MHGIVAGGGLGPEGATWLACRPGFFLPVRVLSRLFRRRFLEELQQLYDQRQLKFFGEHARLGQRRGVQRLARAAGIAKNFSLHRPPLGSYARKRAEEVRSRAGERRVPAAEKKARKASSTGIRRPRR